MRNDSHRSPRLLLATFLVIAVAAQPAWAASNRAGSAVHRFADGEAVAGSAALLVTNAEGATLSLRTAQLEPGAYTIWWVVFNRPEHCTDPFAPGFECGSGDLFAADVGTSVLYATGNVVGGSGRAGFGARLRVSDTSGALFGLGLTNPLEAEIHVVVRTHGPVLPHLVEEQLHTFNGGCDPGQPNEGFCDDVQFAAFGQRLAPAE